MQFAVGSFVVGAGLTQTVTGVVDRGGANLTAELVLFQAARSSMNVLASTQTNAYADYRGVDTGTIRSARAVVDGYSGFNFKMASGAESLGDHSIICGGEDNFSQFGFDRKGKITAASPGQFTITFSQNDFAGDVILYIAFAGDDIDYSFIVGTSGSQATSAFPRGLLNLPVPIPASSGSTSNGTGGQNVPWGFASRSDTNYGTSNLHVVLQGNNFSAQLTNRFWSNIDATTGILSAFAPTISTWGDTSVTIANGIISAISVVFCGENLICTSGVINTGDEVIDTGIDAIALMLMSTGYDTSSSVQSPIGQFTYGWSNGVTQWGYWGGEKTNGNTGPSYGARIISDDSIIRFGTPNGSSTTFTAVAAVDSISPFGTATLNWSVNDAVDRQILWFAIGVATTPVPPTAGGGIYVLVPQKKQDTVWLAVDPEDTALFKIPDPNAFTALVGDE